MLDPRPAEVFNRAGMVRLVEYAWMAQLSSFRCFTSNHRPGAKLILRRGVDFDDSPRRLCVNRKMAT